MTTNHQIIFMTLLVSLSISSFVIKNYQIKSLMQTINPEAGNDKIVLRRYGDEEIKTSVDYKAGDMSYLDFEDDEEVDKDKLRQLELLMEKHGDQFEKTDDDLDDLDDLYSEELFDPYHNTTYLHDPVLDTPIAIPMKPTSKYGDMFELRLEGTKSTGIIWESDDEPEKKELPPHIIKCNSESRCQFPFLYEDNKD